MLHEPPKIDHALFAANPSLRGAEIILVVDDERILREFCTTVLTNAGYNVLAADDGYLALAKSKAARAPIHLARLDVRMPRMSGPELLVEGSEAESNVRVHSGRGYQGLTSRGRPEGVPDVRGGASLLAHLA